MNCLEFAWHRVTAMWILTTITIVLYFVFCDLSSLNLMFLRFISFAACNCHYFLLHACMLKSYPTFCDPVDYSLLSSSLHGILWARILEWVAMPSSRGFSWSRDRTYISCVSCIAGGFFTHRATREALFSSTAWYYKNMLYFTFSFYHSIFLLFHYFFAIKIYNAISIIIPVSWCMDAKISLEHTFTCLKMELLGI